MMAEAGRTANTPIMKPVRILASMAGLAALVSAGGPPDAPLPQQQRVSFDWALVLDSLPPPRYEAPAPPEPDAVVAPYDKALIYGTKPAPHHPDDHVL